MSGCPTKRFDFHESLANRSDIHSSRIIFITGLMANIPMSVTADEGRSDRVSGPSPIPRKSGFARCDPASASAADQLALAGETHKALAPVCGGRAFERSSRPPRRSVEVNVPWSQPGPILNKQITYEGSAFSGNHVKSIVPVDAKDSGAFLCLKLSRMAEQSDLHRGKGPLEAVRQRRRHSDPTVARLPPATA